MEALSSRLTFPREDYGSEESEICVCSKQLTRNEEALSSLPLLPLLLPLHFKREMLRSDAIRLIQE
jgi:hypothetical protein